VEDSHVLDAAGGRSPGSALVPEPLGRPAGDGGGAPALQDLLHELVSNYAELKASILLFEARFKKLERAVSDGFSELKGQIGEMDVALSRERDARERVSWRLEAVASATALTTRSSAPPVPRHQSWSVPNDSGFGLGRQRGRPTLDR
jgi:hypothetical protein